MPLDSTQRELLRLTLRNTLNRHGIPVAWIGADMLPAMTPGGQTGIHLRILIKHWDPRLLTHAVAFQNSLIVRLLAFDPLASSWLMGISWQFALPDDTACPAMPHPGSWTAEAQPRAASDVQPEAVGGSGDVIAGPVRIGGSTTPAAAGASGDVRSGLERLFASRDAQHKLNAERMAAGEPTQPMFLKTQPMDLGDEPVDPQPGRARP